MSLIMTLTVFVLTVTCTLAVARVRESRWVECSHVLGSSEGHTPARLLMGRVWHRGQVVAYFSARLFFRAVNANAAARFAELLVGTAQTSSGSEAS